MSRPKKQQHELRASVIGIRLTSDERKFIASESDACGITPSSFIRKRSLGKRVAAQSDLRVLAELRRLGGLLKHLHNETRGAYSALTAKCLKEINEYIRRLNAYIEKQKRESQ